MTRNILIALLLAPFLAACPPAQELDPALVAALAEQRGMIEAGAARLHRDRASGLLNDQGYRQSAGYYDEVRARHNALIDGLQSLVLQGGDPASLQPRIRAAAEEGQTFLTFVAAQQAVADLQRRGSPEPTGGGGPTAANPGPAGGGAAADAAIKLAPVVADAAVKVAGEARQARTSARQQLAASLEEQKLPPFSQAGQP